MGGSAAGARQDGSFGVVREGKGWVGLEAFVHDGGFWGSDLTFKVQMLSDAVTVRLELVLAQRGFFMPNSMHQECSYVSNPKP